VLLSLCLFFCLADCLNERCLVQVYPLLEVVTTLGKELFEVHFEDDVAIAVSDVRCLLVVVALYDWS
jgi:hypothetical protein